MPFQDHDPRKFEEQSTSPVKDLTNEVQRLGNEIARLERLQDRATTSDEWMSYWRPLEAFRRMRQEAQNSIARHIEKQRILDEQV